MTFFIALLIFILVYVVAKWLLGFVESVKAIAEPVAVVLGILAALFYAHVI